MTDAIQISNCQHHLFLATSGKVRIFNSHLYPIGTFCKSVPAHPLERKHLMHQTGSFSETLNLVVAPGMDLQADLLRREIAKLADIPDAEIEKFVKPITVKGKRRWLIEFWHPYKHLVPKNKQRKRIRARSPTKAGAIMEAKHHYLRCKDEIKQAVALPKKATVAEFAAPWIGPYCHRGHRGKPLAQATVVSMHALLHNQVIPLFGDYPLDQVEYDVMDDVFRKLAMEDYAEHYISNIKGVLSCLLKSARRKKLIAHLPEFPPVPIAKPEPVFLSNECKEAILKAAANGLDMTAFLFLLDTGIRPGEELGLTPSNVCVNSGWMTIDRSRTPHSKFALPEGGLGNKIPASPGYKLPKTKQSLRGIPLTDPLCDAIKAHLDLSGPVLFAGMTYPALYARFKSAVDRAGVGMPLTLYSLRHAFATTLLNRGVPHQFIQKWLGHTTITMTEHYARMAPYRVTRITNFDNLDERAVLNLALYDRLPRGNSVATRQSYPGTGE